MPDPRGTMGHPMSITLSGAVPLSSVHSRYQRHLTDLPWGTRPVYIRLTVRKFVCQNPSGQRHLFTERLPAFVTAYATTTQRLVTALRAISMALGGQAGPGSPLACGGRPVLPLCSG